MLLFHAGHLQGGFLGVDLFFALSGFLITSLLLRDVEQGSIRLLAFWERRFRRLLPVVFVLITVVALAAWAFGSPAELDGVRRTGGWALGYVANWHFIGDADGYWASFDRPSMFDHLWSLAIEEQFYVVWPLVVLAVSKLSKRSNQHRNLLVIALGGVVGSFVAMLALYHPGSDPTRVYMGTDTRAASILVGAAMATVPARQAATSVVAALGRRADQVVAALAFAIGLSWLLVDGASSAALYRGGLLLHSAAAAVVVGGLVLLPDGRLSNALSWRPLVWVGVRSYGLYLWHWPVYVMLSSERTGLDGPLLTVLRVAASTVLAAASFRFVEDPIRRRATWVRDRRGIAALAGAVAVVAATLIVLPLPRREIAAFDPSTIVASSVMPHAPPPTLGSVLPTTTQSTRPPSSAEGSKLSSAPAVSDVTSPEPVPTSMTPTTTIAAVAKPQIASLLWMGDSIAYDVAPALGAALTSAGLRFNTYAFPEMRLVGDGRLAMLRKLRIELPGSGVDVVVVQLAILDAQSETSDQEAALDELHALVVSNGAQLVLVSSPPTEDEARDDQLVEMTVHARAIADADPSSTVFLDSSPVWGTSYDDDLDDDGTPERKRDGDHVCPAGAARFALWLTAELTARFDGAAPTPPTEWALGSWVTDARYDAPVGACAPLD